MANYMLYIKSAPCVFSHHTFPFGSVFNSCRAASSSSFCGDHAQTHRSRSGTATTNFTTLISFCSWRLLHKDAYLYINWRGVHFEAYTDLPSASIQVPKQRISATYMLTKTF